MLAKVVKFDEFELDCNRYELLRAGRRIKLEKLPMELLILLVEKDGHLVTRQEIVDRLWGPDVFLDTEHGINTAVRKIRNVLRDDPEQPQYLQTVTGKGYRFIAPTTVVGNGTRSEAGVYSVATGRAEGEAVTPFDSGQSTLIRPDRVRQTASIPQVHPESGSVLRIATLVLVVAVLLAGTIIGMNVVGLRTRLFAHEAKPKIHTLAVLPLENLSGDPAQEYFADGMTDELITMVARNSGLRVISRTSAMQYRKVHRPLPDIARELGVDGILEGSVGRTANRVHINVQLIFAPTDTHLWAESYDRDFSDVSSLQSELARAIARQVGVTASSATKPEKRISPEAHDAYLLGRYYWFTSDDVAKSQEYFQRAIDLQSDYAAAWSGLADSYGARAVVGEVAPERVMPQAEAAAKKALELDDSLAEAHNSMAGIYLFYRWNWELAERESARAVELNPNFAEAHHLRGYVLRTLNRNDEDLQAQRRSLELDPVARPWAVGYSLIRMRDFDTALREARIRIEAQPNNPDLSALLSDVYWLKGREAESVHEWERTLVIEGRQESAAALRTAFRRGGYASVMRWHLGELKKKAAKGYVSPLEFANDYARLKLKEETMHYLERAYEDRAPHLVFLQSDPTFDFLHFDSRYKALVTKIGLPPAS